MARVEKVRRIIPISGKDSLATAIVQTEREPRKDYEYIFCDVGMELPETYKWLNDVEKKLGYKIKRIGKSLRNKIAEVGKLPCHTNRFCTLHTKIVPYQDYIEKDPSTDRIISYIGFRADEKDRIPASGVERLSQARGNVTVDETYPLIEEGVAISDVYRILEQKGVEPPNFFWKRLFESVYEQCGPASQKFIDEAPPWTKAYWFSWRSRSNCSMCFYQRMYEWVGLLEHHPELFAEAEELERVYGGAKSEYRMERWEGELKNTTTDFTLHLGWPLAHIRKEAGRLFERRVKDVYNEIVEKRKEPRHSLDLLSTTSCGAYCGK